jgi:hypothetical protein
MDNTPGIYKAFLKTALSGVVRLSLKRSPPLPVVPLAVDWSNHRIFFRSQTDIKPYAYTIDEYEELAGVHYTSVLLAENAATAHLVTKRCQQLLVNQQLMPSTLWHSAYYRPALRKAQVAPVYIAWTGYQREWGLFARTYIPEDALIGEYTGKLALISCFFKTINPYCFRYPLPLSQWLWFTIDAETYGNETRFLNHNAIDPNCIARIIYDNGFLHVVICALRPIQADEELTYDYGLTLWGQKRVFESTGET